MFKNKNIIRTLCIAILVCVLIILLQRLEVLAFLRLLLLSITPFFIGFFLAWLSLPISDYVHYKSKQRISKKKANKIAIGLLLTMIIFFWLVIIPVVFLQLLSLAEEFPTLVDSFIENLYNLKLLLEKYSLIDISYDNIIQTTLNYLNVNSFNELLTGENIFEITSFLGLIIGSITSLIKNIVFLLGQWIIAFVISLYFIDDLKTFTKKTANFVFGSANDRIVLIIKDVSKTVLGYFKGLLIVCTFVFVFVTIGSMIIGLPSPVLLGFIAAVFNVIPYLGPVIGGIPIMIIAATQGFGVFIASLVVIFGTQFIEANFLQPKIMSKATNLHPVSIIVGLLVFGGLFGIFGMIIATPTLASLNVIISYSKYDITL